MHSVVSRSRCLMRDRTREALKTYPIPFRRHALNATVKLFTGILTYKLWWPSMALERRRLTNAGHKQATADFKARDWALIANCSTDTSRRPALVRLVLSRLV